MILVLDTCAACQIILEGDRKKDYAAEIVSAEKVIAPSLFDAEIANVMWKYVKGGYMDEENAKLSMALAIQLVDEFVPTVDIAIESLHEAIRLNHSVYDVYFMVLARRNGATMLTSDERLKRLCLDNGVNVL